MMPGDIDAKTRTASVLTLRLGILGLSLFAQCTNSQHLKPVGMTEISFLSNLSQCAVNCELNSIDQLNSSSGIQELLCQGNGFHGILPSCVARDCTVREYLDFLNTTKTTCGEPVLDHRDEIRVSTLVMGAVATVFMSMRILSKVFGSRLWTADDYLIIASFVCAIGVLGIAVKFELLTWWPQILVILFTIMIQLLISHGLGQDIWVLSDDEITTFYKYLLVCEFLYVMALTLIKLAILVFFLQIFLEEKFRKVVKWTIGITMLMTVIFATCGAIQKIPIWLLWEGWKDKTRRGESLDINALVIAHAALNVALDLWMLALPVTQLYHLGLKLKKKLGVISLFGVGIFLLIASCIRLRNLVDFATSFNATANSQGVLIWSSVEICIGIMVASMPHARQLMRLALNGIKVNGISISGSNNEGIFVDRSLESMDFTQAPGLARNVGPKVDNPALNNCDELWLLPMNIIRSKQRPGGSLITHTQPSVPYWCSFAWTAASSPLIGVVPRPRSFQLIMRAIPLLAFPAFLYGAMINHGSVSHFIRFMSTLAGRDKSFYFVQYSSRLIRALIQPNGSAGLTKRLSAIIAQLILTRKLLRMGNSIDALQKASIAITQLHQDGFLAYITTIRQLCLAGYLACDHVVALQRLGVCTKRGIQQIDLASSRFWFSSALCNVILQLYCFCELQRHKESSKKSDVCPERQIVLEGNVSAPLVVSNLCDLGISAAEAGATRTNESFVSSCGVVNGLIGIHTVYKLTSSM